jgi:selenide, water dikinase
LHRALASLPRYAADPDVLVGLDTFDDAAVVRLTPDIALIQTVDFFTPVVDDPYDYGQIAAANALSDVYAMGGTPRTALNLVCWPPSGLAPEILGAILAGGADKVHEAGAVLVGGHSIQDEELKYGLAVTGIAHPDEIVTNAALRPGDALVLTKPLGTGILTTALKRGARSEASLAEAVASMKALNGSAMAIARAAGVRGATDVTGFGLLGHAAQSADAAGVTLVFQAGALPAFEGARELGPAGHVPGGGAANRAYFGPRVAVDPAVAEADVLLAFDPQTSGGLLLAVPAAGADALVAALRDGGWPRAARIGAVEPRGETSVRLLA